MIITVINHSKGKLTDAEILPVIRAINRQIKEDFEPYWSLGATLRLEGRSTNKTILQTAADMRGDAIIYLWSSTKDDDAVGYHTINNKGIPYGFVFLDVADELKEPWSITLSHEALELIADPDVNLLVIGPHPNPKQRRNVFYMYEMCDAVQNEKYKIDGIEVSNFVLPLYFTSDDEYDGRNDFLGTVNPDGSTLRSFGINPGGYVAYYDPKARRLLDYDARDPIALKRKAIKKKIGEARRMMRYREGIKKKGKE